MWIKHTFKLCVIAKKIDNAYCLYITEYLTIKYKVLSHIKNMLTSRQNQTSGIGKTNYRFIQYEMYYIYPGNSNPGAAYTIIIHATHWLMST